MRCNICDAGLSNPVFNRSLDTWEPCGTCLDVIFSVFEDLPDPRDPEEEETDENNSLDNLEDFSYNIS